MSEGVQRASGVTVLHPESDRYRAELVFVPGLWAEAAVWRPVAAGFAHRGWQCVLVDRAPSPAANGATFARHVEEVVGTREMAPVVIGHDAGALIALDLAARGLVRGAVAVAPLLEGLRPILSRVQRLALCLRADDAAIPPPDPGHAYFARVPAERQAELARGLVAERAGWLRQVERLATPARPAVPALIVGQQADPVCSQLLAEISARGVEADFLRLQGGHWPMLEPRADDWITQVHRWIIKRVGHGLLVLRGDEDLV